MDAFATEMQPGLPGTDERGAIFALHKQVEALMGENMPMCCRLKPEAAEVLGLVPTEFQPKVLKDLPLSQSGKVQAAWLNREIVRTLPLFSNQTGDLPDEKKNGEERPGQPLAVKTAEKPTNAVVHSRQESEDGGNPEEKAAKDTSDRAPTNMAPEQTAGNTEIPAGKAEERVAVGVSSHTAPHRPNGQVAERFLQHRAEKPGREVPVQHEAIPNPNPLVVPRTVVTHKSPSYDPHPAAKPVEAKEQNCTPLEKRAINAWDQAKGRYALKSGWTKQEYVTYFRNKWFEWQQEEGQQRPEYLPDPLEIEAELENEKNR